MKSWVEHLCFWRSFGNEAKFSVVAFIPLFIAILLPIAYPFFISLTYANQSVVERTAVILDADNSAMSRDMMLSLDATQGLNITKRVDTMEDGVQAVMSREADAFIFLPSDYSSKIKRFEQGNIKVYVYATNMMIYASVLTAIQETVLAKNVEISVEQIANPKGIVHDKAVNTLDPVSYHKHILYSPTLAYATFITPLLFCLVFHQMGLLILGFSVGFHREIHAEFRQKRLWLIDYFWRYLYYILFFIIGTIFVYVYLCPLFAWPRGESALEMMKLILTMIVCNFPLAAMIASFCYARYSSFQIVLGSTLIFFTLSGYVWPSFALPEWVRCVTNYLAIAQTAQGIIKIAFKGGTYADCAMEVAQLVRIFGMNLVIALIVIHRDLFIRPIVALCAKRKGGASQVEVSPQAE